MCIDLKENVLRVEDEKIPFLPENEIPKQLEEHMLGDEPKIEGPGGMKVGARTGTVEQHGKSTPADLGQRQMNLGQRQGQGSASQAGNVQSTTSAVSSNHVLPAQPTLQAPPSFPLSPPPSSSVTPSSAGVSPESVAKIMDLGFTREEAVQALQQVGGDVELAIGLLL